MRLIDADALLAEAMVDGAYGYVDAKQIADAPTIDAVLVKHGEWVEHGEPNERGTYELWYYACSICGNAGLNGMPYCPNCGAKMDEVEE